MKTLLICPLMISLALIASACSVVPRKTVALPIYFRSVQEFDDWAQDNVRILVNTDEWRDTPEFIPLPVKDSSKE